MNPAPVPKTTAPPAEWPDRPEAAFAAPGQLGPPVPAQKNWRITDFASI